MHAFVFDFRFEDRVFHAIFVDRPEHVSAGGIADELYNVYRGDLTVASLVIVRPPVDRPFRENDLGNQEIRPLLDRLPHLPLYFLGSCDFEHFLTSNLNPAVEDILTTTSRDALITAIRQFELTCFAKDAGALLQTTGARVFRAPSGKFCRNFLRVGNVQIHRAALDSYFFWLLPWLKDCQAIVTETWTISSIALNASRLLSRYDPNKHSRCKVDMLSEYHDGSSELLPDTKSILERVVAGGDGKVLVLISCCMSGNVVNRLRDTIETCGLDVSQHRFGALYSLADGHGVQALCDISDGGAGTKFECFDSLPQEEGATAIFEIDRRTYFPLRVEETQILLNARAARTHFAVFERYKQSGLFSVHRDSFLNNGQRLRHHAIFTDLLPIIDREPFKGRLEAQLTTTQNAPALVLSPPHAAGVELGKRVTAFLETKFSKSIRRAEHLDLNFQGTLRDEEKEVRTLLSSLDENAMIFIVDDESVSGRRLTRYQLSLRELNYRGQIHYFIGLARPAQASLWESRKQELRFRQPKGSAQHLLTHVEFVVLPDWDRDKCPWCKELDLYKQIVRKSGTIPKLLWTRADRLHRATSSAPMTEDVFFRSAQDAPMQLTPNSIFVPAPATEADVFAAVACVIEQLRTDTNMTDHLQSAYPEVRVLSAENYLGSRFNDSVIRASVLRAAHSCELERPHSNGESKRAQMALEVIFNPSRDINNLTFELFLASAIHKLPKLTFGEPHLLSLDQRGHEEIRKLLSSAFKSVP